MYGIHLDHHTLSIARDGELLASEPLAVETGEGEARAGAAALATARGRPDEVSLNHWRELGRNEFAARNVAREMLVQLRTLGIAERIDAVVAVPADLDPGVLATLRGALHAAGVDTRDFVDSAALGAAAHWPNAGTTCCSRRAGAPPPPRAYRAAANARSKKPS